MSASMIRRTLSRSCTLDCLAIWHPSIDQNFNERSTQTTLKVLFPESCTLAFRKNYALASVRYYFELLSRTGYEFGYVRFEANAWRVF